MANKIMITDSPNEPNGAKTAKKVSKLAALNAFEANSRNKRVMDFYAKNLAKQLRSLLLRWARANKGLTQIEVSEKLGIFQSSYSNIEKKGVKSSYLEAISELLDIPLDLLKNPTIVGVQQFIYSSGAEDVESNTEKDLEAQSLSQELMNIETLDLKRALNSPSSKQISPSMSLKKVVELNQSNQKGIDFDNSVVILLVTPHQTNIILQALDQLQRHYKTPDRIMEIQELRQTISDSYSQALADQ